MSTKYILSKQKVSNNSRSKCGRLCKLIEREEESLCCRDMGETTGGVL